MSKFSKKITALLLCAVMSIGFGCNTGGPGGTGDTGGSEQPDHQHNFVDGFCIVCGDPDPAYNPDGGVTGDESFSYYKTTTVRDDKKVYVFNRIGEAADNDTLNTVAAIQGLFSRKNVTFYIDGKYMTNGTNADCYYLDRAVNDFGIIAEDVDHQTVVQMYMDAWSEMVAQGVWGSKIDLKTGFNDSSNYYSAYTEENPDSAEAGYATPGYIVYAPGTYSVNIASTLAAITGFIPVSSEQKGLYDAMGLVEKMDVTNEMWSYRWCFNACLTELSGEGLVHQTYKDSNGATNFFVRDYGVANKFLYVYYDNTTTINNSLKKQIHNFLDKNIPIIGYAYNEVPDVALFSQYGQFLVPTDYTSNLTFHLGDIFRPEEGFTQPNKDSDKPAEQGKHYVAFVVSDGDNAQYWQNTSIFSTSYMNATGREDDDFAVTWSITPSLADMMPLVMDAAYHGNITTENDYFCAPVSGQGYIDAGNFYNAGAQYMDTFMQNLDTYLKRSDLGVTTIIGAENYSGGIYETLNAYAEVEALKGGLVLNGSKYFGGAYAGGVYWKNGKPFIVPRDSLWSTTPAYIAARINMYSSSETGSDVTNTDAYSVINVHPWSHNYSDIRTIVNMLNDNVEVVSLDRIVKMMTDNVTEQEDTVDHFAMPASGSGWTISDSQLQQNPQLIPTNPMFNDFLLWCEDWTGDVTYRSSDAATSDVYPTFKTNMEIAANGRAVKEKFNLPLVDNVWITFYARANSTDPAASTAISVDMTVDGQTKTVIANAVLRGVKGTETPVVTGDGWQTFAFPIKQYFPDYNGKEASLTIKVNGDISVKIDNFSVKDRFIVPGENTVCTDVYSNEFENGSTEDWMLGDQFLTSQYYHWAAVDRETLKPKGTLQVDASDGGGNEKRNGNTNVWFAKNVVLPDASAINLELAINGGAKSKLAMYVDGQYIVLIDWTKNQQIGTQNLSLSEICAQYDIESLANKEVTFVFEVRDNANDDNGSGQDYNLNYFRIKTA